MGRPLTAAAASPKAPLPTPVRVVAVADGWSVHAARDVAEDEVILSFHGRVVARPTRHSLQISARRHLEGPEGIGPQEMEGTYGWRYLNHSCDPNGAVRGLDLVAVRAIPAGAEITFDYNSTEWELASPFRCACGAAACVGVVRGFRHLDGSQRTRILHRAAEYLRVRLVRGSRRNAGAPGG